MQRISFEGNAEIGAYVKLTSSYVIIGRSEGTLFKQNFINLPITMIETTLNSIRTVGSLCQGNKYGLLLPNTTQDHEMLHIRQYLPESVKIRRIDERLNALGNIIVCNDHMALVHPEIGEDTMEIIESVLNVPVYKRFINEKPLVGTYSVMNNQGMLVDPNTTQEEIAELKDLLNLRVAAGTVNLGKEAIGSGVVINDLVGFCGRKTTNTELGFMENLFLLTDIEV